MKKSTLLALVITAIFICVGWIWFDSIGITFLVAAAVSAVVALITALRKKEE